MAVTPRRRPAPPDVPDDLDGADLDALADCRADGPWLRAARLDRCRFDGCDLTGSDWYGAQVTASSVVTSPLDGSELSAVRFTDVALHGSSLAEVRGLADLRGVAIDAHQVPDIAVPAPAARDIRITDREHDEVDRTG